MSHASHGSEERPLLIKTQACPACRTAVALLDRAGVAYDTVTDTDAGYDEAVRRYGVRHVPTLVLHPTGGWTAMTGTEAIREYIDSAK